jgi:hypothetical protein
MTKVLAAALATSLILSSATANAAPRAPAPIDEAEGLGGSPFLVIGLVALVLAGLIVLLSDSEDAPLSP